MDMDSAPKAAKAATKKIRTSLVAAAKPRRIPRTFTSPSWLPRMKLDRSVGRACFSLFDLDDALFGTKVTAVFSFLSLVNKGASFDCFPTMTHQGFQ
jgi:hypothetical protein